MLGLFFPHRTVDLNDNNYKKLEEMNSAYSIPAG